jgi:hypothetical protein
MVGLGSRGLCAVFVKAYIEKHNVRIKMKAPNPPPSFFSQVTGLLDFKLRSFSTGMSPAAKIDHFGTYAH